MRRLVRLAAAVAHLGPRRALLNVAHRSYRRFRRLERYSFGRESDLTLSTTRIAFLHHAGGCSFQDGRFTAVGRTFAVGDPPDWHPPAPLLWLFNLHYFAYLPFLAPLHRAALVRDWIARCPPRTGSPAWMPYTLSLRLRNWTKSLLETEAWPPSDLDRALASIAAQADCLADTIEVHLGGNHLLENGLTLCFLAECFSGRQVERWRKIGGKILDTEFSEQFLSDGGHFERSPMYHGILLHGLLDLFAVLRSGPLRETLSARLPSLLAYARQLRHPDGGIALFNDSAIEIAPSPEDLLAYADLLGLSPSDERRTFPETGYHVWSDSRDAFLLDAGPIGPDYVPAHAHGDIFSFELSRDGERLVVDGGTSTYEEGPEREWVRSTRAHNTVELDGQDQCEFFGAFRVGRRGRPRDVRVELTPEGLHAAGWHDAYRRLPGRPRHEREICFLRPAVLLVWDTVHSAREHEAVSRIRFAPGVTVSVDGPVEATVVAGDRKLTFRAFGGELSKEQGFYAPRFGQRLPCEVIALQRGRTPEFGYALADRDVPLSIGPDGATVGEHTVPRWPRTLQR